MIARSRSIVRLVLRILGHSLIGHISNIAIISIGSILDMLGTTIGKSNRIGSTHNTGTITAFSGIEGSLGVVISNSIFIGVWFRSIRYWFMISRGRLIGWGWVVWSWGRLVGRGRVSNYCRLVNNNRGRVVGSRGRVVRGRVVGS